jgi:hypothetical protein
MNANLAAMLDGHGGQQNMPHNRFMAVQVRPLIVTRSRTILQSAVDDGYRFVTQVVHMRLNITIYQLNYNGYSVKIST